MEHIVTYLLDTEAEVEKPVGGIGFSIPPCHLFDEEAEALVQFGGRTPKNVCL